MSGVASAKSMDDPRVQLLHDALAVLDKYSAKLGNRDRVKSLDEDQDELLHRVRVALELLIRSSASRDEATKLVERIGAVLGTEPARTQSAS